jgi:PAS domain S-box-containing protein
MAPTDLPPEIQELAQSDESIVVVDTAGTILLMTKAAEEMFGIAFDDIAGETVELLVPEKLRWGHQAYRRGFLAEPNPREMDPGLEPHGARPMDETTFPIHVDLEPRTIDGKLYVAAHVTERDASGDTTGANESPQATPEG